VCRCCEAKRPESEWPVTESETCRRFGGGAGSDGDGGGGDVSRSKTRRLSLFQSPWWRQQAKA
jgi:hypothetical protein